MRGRRRSSAHVAERDGTREPGELRVPGRGLSSRRRSLRVPVQEFELDAKHVVEARTSLIDVIVTAATAMKLAAWRSFGNAQRRAGRRHRVLLGDDEQDGAADGSGTSHRPTPGKAEQ